VGSLQGLWILLGHIEAACEPDGLVVKVIVTHLALFSKSKVEDSWAVGRRPVIVTRGKRTWLRGCLLRV
jgi:hypothetical protein